MEAYIIGWSNLQVGFYANMALIATKMCPYEHETQALSLD
jgi:hypothetical protein